MKLKLSFLLFAVLWCANISNAHANERLAGVQKFYQNFEKYRLFIGPSYGTFKIGSASLSQGGMVVSYMYRDGQLLGNLEQNGVYSGSYSTNGSSGSFYMRFESDGTATGKWNCMAGCGGIFAKMSGLSSGELSITRY